MQTGRFDHAAPRALVAVALLSLLEACPAAKLGRLLEDDLAVAESAERTVAVEDTSESFLQAMFHDEARVSPPASELRPNVANARVVEPRPVEPVATPAFTLGVLRATRRKSVIIVDAERGQLAPAEYNDLLPALEQTTDAMTLELAAVVEGKCPACRTGRSRKKAIHSTVEEFRTSNPKNISLTAEGVRFTFKVDARTVSFTVGWDRLADAIDQVIEFARHCHDQDSQSGLGSQICDKWRTEAQR